MDDDEMPVGGAVHIRLNAVVGAVTRRHKGRAGVFQLQAAHAAMGYHLHLWRVQMQCIHVSLSPL